MDVGSFRHGQSAVVLTLDLQDLKLGRLSAVTDAAVSFKHVSEFQVYRSVASFPPAVVLLFLTPSSPTDPILHFMALEELHSCCRIRIWEVDWIQNQQPDARKLGQQPCGCFYWRRRLLLAVMNRFSSHSAVIMSQRVFSLLKGGISFIKQVKTSVGWFWPSVLVHRLTLCHCAAFNSWNNLNLISMLLYDLHNKHKHLWITQISV